MNRSKTAVSIGLRVDPRASITRHQSIAEGDIDAVTKVLRSDWITQGPKIEEFEKRIAAYCGARYGIAFSSGTAALHAACFAAGIESGDEVITTPLTFVSTANAAVYLGAAPIFADIDEHTLTIDPQEVARRVTRRTRAILPVHFAGLPCDMGQISKLARQRGLIVIEDACHALGAQWRSPEGRMERIGSCSHSDMAIFSFHPVKHVTSGEGGMVLTNRKDLVSRLRDFRHHGIARPGGTDATSDEPWAYQMNFLGYNYRITDFQCALGLKQLERIEEGLERRRNIAASYHEGFRNLELVPQQGDGLERRHAWHLYVVQMASERLRFERVEVFKTLRKAGIPVNVHYLPVYLHPFYQERFGYRRGYCPRAERYYQGALSFPIFPRMSDTDVAGVIEVVQGTIKLFIGSRNS